MTTRLRNSASHEPFSCRSGKRDSESLHAEQVGLGSRELSLSSTPRHHAGRPRPPTSSPHGSVVTQSARFARVESRFGASQLPLGLRGSHRAKSASRSIWLYGWSKSLDLGKEKLIINRVMCYAAGQLE